MKRFNAILLVLLLPVYGFCQQYAKQQVDSLKYVIDMPYLCAGGIESGCATQTFWNVVMLKQEAIPLLIDKLGDSTITPAGVSVFGFNYTVADIAYSALQEIVHGIPTLPLMGIDNTKNTCHFCAYWEYLRADHRHRVKFKKAVKSWYKRSKPHLLWVESNKFETCACGTNHPNNGHYELGKH
ncbi:MAG: hypothetical protein V4658_05905 [Bacteroidota bacterium]